MILVITKKPKGAKEFAVFMKTMYDPRSRVLHGANAIKELEILKMDSLIKTIKKTVDIENVCFLSIPDDDARKYVPGRFILYCDVQSSE